MARTYKNPPLIEAVCQFQFVSSQPWDWTIPGLIYEQIRENFPHKEQVNLLEARVNPGEGSIIQQAQPRVRFLSKDRTSLIQIAPDHLSVHQLHPYNTWDSFKSRILEHLDIYRQLANPVGLNLIGLRYVNRIEIPHTGVQQLEDYFTVLPQIPAPVPQMFQSFLVQAEIPYRSPESALRMIFGTVTTEEVDHVAYALDLDMFSTKGNAPDVDHVVDWLEVAHLRIEDTFDASFTEKAHHQIFQEVSP